MTEESDFKVGNTTFNTCFYVTVSDYGAPIPECHSSGPISRPMPIPLASIINMVERGLHVHPKDDIDSERIYFFLKEYNRVATQINNASGEVLNPLASKAEDYFYKKVKFTSSVQALKNERENPNPFTKVVAPPEKYSVKKYNNEFVANKFKKKKQNKDNIDLRTASEHKLYEAFSSPNPIAPDGRIIMDPNTISGSTMPSAFDDIAFGD